MRRQRNPQLDLLRAAAVLVVIIYHIVLRWPSAYPVLAAVTDYGQYGVDLFFVLSGWLIGGLYWHESQARGRVRVGRFVLSRVTRTVPPYLVALAVAWLGVAVFRGQPFDWGYLAFVQNYYERIPYFDV